MVYRKISKPCRYTYTTAESSCLFFFRLIGFEALGNSDAFETATLELRLSQSGMFVPYTGMHFID